MTTSVDNCPTSFKEKWGRCKCSLYPWWEQHTFHGKRRHKQILRRPWSTPASACGLPRGPAPSGSTCIQPTDQNTQNVFLHFTFTLTNRPVELKGILWLLRCLYFSYSPGGIRGSNEEINHHSVTHVEALLNSPAKGKAQREDFSYGLSGRSSFFHICAAVLMKWSKSLGPIHSHRLNSSINHTTLKKPLALSKTLHPTKCKPDQNWLLWISVFLLASRQIKQTGAWHSRRLFSLMTDRSDLHKEYNWGAQQELTGLWVSQSAS